MEKKGYLIEMKYHYTIPLRELHQGLGFLGCSFAVSFGPQILPFTVPQSLHFLKFNVLYLVFW
jgi:hypothetical protein